MATKRKDGRYQKSVTYNKVKYVVYGRTIAELNEKARKKIEELEKGYDKLKNPTVEEYFDKWIDERKETVSESTIRTQKKHFGVMKKIKIEVYQNCPFGTIKMIEFNKKEHSAKDILLCLQTSLKDGRKTQTVNDYMALLRHMFSDACNECIIDRNPCKLIKNLKRTEEKARDTEHRALSIEEQNAFFSSERCKSSYYYNVFCFAIYTGMRIGEIGALKHSDIKDGNICVKRTVTRAEAGNHVIGKDAKTEAGKRLIPMTEKTKKIVNAQIKMNGWLDGKVISLDDRIFKAYEGGLLLATPINREIKRICKVAGIEPFTMHALRATFATRAIESGMNPKTLQEILGHSNYNITMSLYGHCLENTKQKEMDNVIIRFETPSSQNGSQNDETTDKMGVVV